MKRTGIVETLKGKVTDKPGKSSVGKGGRRREKTIMDAVDEAVSGATPKRRKRKKKS